MEEKDSSESVVELVIATQNVIMDNQIYVIDATIVENKIDFLLLQM